MTYQWYFFDAPITGANSNILTVPNVQGSAVGTYTLKVWTFGQVNNGQIDFGQTNQSDDAILQINLTGSGTEQVQAFDQLLDSENDPNVLVIGGVVGSSTQSGSGPHPLAASTVVSGFTGSQIFNTTGSGTGPGEVICGVIGGSSDWLTFLPATSGTLFLNTDGSTYDTVMAVFKRNPTNSAALDLITCDNNSGTNGKTSAVVFPVQAGVTNYVVVDGINGATGILQLNYALVTATRVQFLPPTPENMQHVQVIGRTNMHFILQASTNFSAWTSLLTTSSPAAIFDYIDPTSTNLPQRYYRALLLP